LLRVEKALKENDIHERGLEEEKYQ
jgi:hypothetical protein